jgi:hypothetical protein
MDIQEDHIDVNKQTSRDDTNKVIITTLKNLASYRKIK